MRTADQSLQLSDHPVSFRPYKENFEDVAKICEQSGRKPSEEIRELLNEALRARQEQDKNGSDLDSLITTISRQTDWIQKLAQHAQQEYGLLLEVLASGYGARSVVWKYIAEPLLLRSGLSKEQIVERYEQECAGWNGERDSTAELIEKAIKDLVSNHQNPDI